MSRARPRTSRRSTALTSTHPVPEDIAAFFTPVAEARQAFDTFVKKHAAAVSPLAKALLAPEQYAVQETLEEIIAMLQQKQEALLAGLGETDTLWQTDRPAALAALPMLWQSLGYLAKWLATLRESLFRMASLPDGYALY
jgi:hypothetical protein